MRLYIDRMPFWTVAAIQLLTFMFILLTAASSLYPIFVIPFFALEVIIFTSIIYKKKRKYFYLGWELEFFLLILFLILFSFDRTFQVSNPSPITITVFAISIIAAETLLLFYFIFRERAVKGILLTLASSTTIIVFLIVIFVMKEGLPAFQENGPIQFITGTEWQPFYNEGSSESAIVKTIINPYDFTISTDDNSIYLLPYSSQNISMMVTNTGGETDTILLSATTALTYEIEKDMVTLAPYESQPINLSINTDQEGRYTVEVKATSTTTSQEETTEIECISSPYGIDLYPDRQTVLGVEAQAGLLQTSLEIINTGNSNDTFTLSIDAPSIFRPSIEETSWNYTTSSGSIELMPSESKNLTIRPRIVTCIEGTYEINITAASQNHPGVIDNSKLIFQYKREHHLLIEETSQPISKNGTANYTLILNGGTNEILGIQIDNPDDKWKCRLQSRGTTILEGEGTTNVTLERNGAITLNLMVTPLQGETGDTSDIKITVMQWGTKPTFGILPFIIGTVLTTFIAVLIAAPLGVGCAIFLAEFCPSKIRKILRPLYELLAGIPSVIYGLWGFLTFGPFIGEHVYPFISNTIGRYIGFFSAESTTGRGVLTASIVLSIMILPIIITLSEDAIRTVRRELKEASLALGATRWQTVKKVILPTASSGIISSIILGTGRAIGETMAVLMIMGSTSQIPTSIFEPVGTMTSVIAGAFGWSFTSDLTRHALFGIGTILFFMIFTLNIIVFMIQKRTTNGKRKKTGWHFRHSKK